MSQKQGESGRHGEELVDADVSSDAQHGDGAGMIRVAASHCNTRLDGAD